VAGVKAKDMPLESSEILFALLVLAFGGGIFLRLVAREKHRREQHLKYRLYEEVEQLKKRQEAQNIQGADQPSKGGPMGVAEIME